MFHGGNFRGFTQLVGMRVSAHFKNIFHAKFDVGYVLFSFFPSPL